MSNGNLPEVPKSWFDLVKEVTILIGSVGGVIAAVMAGCNQQKLGHVREHQDVTASKIEETKAAVDETKTAIKKEASELKAALPSK